MATNREQQVGHMTGFPPAVYPFAFNSMRSHSPFDLLANSSLFGRFGADLPKEMAALLLKGRQVVVGGRWWRGYNGCGWQQLSAEPPCLCMQSPSLPHHSMPEHLSSLSAVNHYLNPPPRPSSPPLPT
eukprot:superscaffoldBa00009063_g23830